MKRVARNAALLLMLAAGSLALPCAAQQEVMPDIYDATPRASMPAPKKAATAEKKAKVTPASHKVRRAKTTKTTHMVLAKAEMKSAAAK
jgi:hypothetical protein